MEWTTDHQRWYRDIYLKSDHWHAIRARKLKQNPECARCGKTGRLDVHHRNYRNLFDVELGDLLTLCRSCHQREHKEFGEARRDRVNYDLYLDVPLTIAKPKRPVVPKPPKPENARDEWEKVVYVVRDKKCFFCGNEVAPEIFHVRLILAPEKAPPKKAQYEREANIVTCAGCFAKLVNEEDLLRLNHLNDQLVADDWKHAYITARKEYRHLTSLPALNNSQ